MSAGLPNTQGMLVNVCRETLLWAKVPLADLGIVGHGSQKCWTLDSLIKALHTVPPLSLRD